MTRRICPVGQQKLSLLFSKYEMQKGQHFYRINKKADTLLYPQVKKIKKCFMKKIDTTIACVNAKIEWGRGGKSVCFFPTKF